MKKIQSLTSLRTRGLYVFLLSTALLIPCFWQTHIQCTDLASHLYNAWLRTQAAAGRLPGLVIVPQKTNFLTDGFLTMALRQWGPWWAEHLLVSFSVLIFFWGTFRFIAALTHGPPWQLTPLLAMLSYGVVFRVGLFNFYLSLGLCLWAASSIRNNRWAYRIPGLLLYLLAIAAHPMPPVWIAAVMLYLYAAEKLKASRRLWAFAAALAAIVAGHFVFRYTLQCYWPGFAPTHVRRYADFIGIGQLAPYVKYFIVIGLVLLLWGPWIWRALRLFSFESFRRNVFAQLIVLHILGSMLAPDALIRAFGYHAGFGLIGIRLSLMTAVIICLLAGPVHLPRWHMASMIFVVALFFSFAYAGERAVNITEARVKAIVDDLPPGARIVMTVRDGPHGIGQLFHILDRPCIGRCFDYANYEPSSGQFSLRATGPNPYVLSNAEDVEDFGNGAYVVKRDDVPLYRIYLCGPGRFQLCAEQARVGELLTTQHISVEPALWR